MIYEKLKKFKKSATHLGVGISVDSIIAKKVYCSALKTYNVHRYIFTLVKIALNVIILKEDLLLIKILPFEKVYAVGFARGI